MGGPRSTAGAPDDASQVDERAVDALYGLEPEDFVAAREALAKRLVANGDRPAAKEVRALRRPTVVAWAANQLGRRDPAGVEALLEAGRRLRAAQEGALGAAGGGGGELRAAMAERRSQLDRLLRAGAEVLGDRAGAHRDELSATLLAASSDPSVGDELRRGRLVREVVAPSGFELFAGSAAPEPSTPPSAPEPAPNGPAGTDRQAERRRAAVERALAEARERALTAAEDVEDAEAELGVAREEVDVAAGEAAALHRAVERADAAVDVAQQRAAALEARVAEARRRAGEADAELEDAGSLLAQLDR